MKSSRRPFLILATGSVTLTAGLSLLWPGVLWAFLVVAPFTALGTFEMLQRRRTLLKIYPIIDRFRYLLEQRHRSPMAQTLTQAPGMAIRECRGRPVGRPSQSRPERGQRAPDSGGTGPVFGKGCPALTGR